jgi:putative MATE family efflux protein
VTPGGGAPAPTALLRTTWSLAWPVIGSFSVESLANLVSMLMVGRLGPDAVAAVGVGVQVLGAVDTVVMAVGTGAVAIVARHCGARERGDAELALAQSVVTAVVLGLCAAVPVALFAPELVAAFDVGPGVIGAGTPFLRVVMFAVPAIAVVFVCSTSLRASGDMRTPLWAWVVIAVVNVGADLVFIFGLLGMPRLGATGAAVGTLCATWTGAAVLLGVLLRGRSAMWIRPAMFAPRLDVVRRVLRVGAPAGLENILLQLGFIFYIVFAARYGTPEVAAYFIGVRILALSFLPGFGFAAAAGTLVGQNLGARRPDEAARSGWTAVGLALALMTSAGVVIFLLARPIARLFTDDPAVLEATVTFIHVLAVAQPFMAVDFTLGGALRGAGDTRFPLASLLVSFYGVRLVWSWLVTNWLGWSVGWLWLALVADFSTRAVLKTWRFRTGRWKTVTV